ncbi:MAG: hypothetical protein IKK73_00575 [Akkermansia sp.]|nr:hypothetical protein [Akkermansia sp.]
MSSGTAVFATGKKQQTLGYKKHRQQVGPAGLNELPLCVYVNTPMQAYENTAAAVYEIPPAAV